MSVSSTDSQFVSSGIAALDRILGGGYSANRVCLIEGTPGTGKTTLALQFLLDGVRNGQRVLHITLSETGGELATVADSHGWSLDGVDVFELSPPELRPERDTRYTMYEPAEVELIETTRAVLAKVEEVRPCRVVFDSLSEILLLAQSPLRYRRQVLALKQYFAGKRCTVLLLNDRGPADNESPHLHSICNGVVQLEQRWPKFGGARRRLRVVKVRGVEFLEGYHDFVIRKGAWTSSPA